MEINPQSNVVPDYSSATYTPCNPGPNQNDVNNKWQTSWNGMQYKLDPYQQLFNKQFGGIQELNVSDFYTIEIIENAQYADIVKLGYYDPESGEMIDSIHIGDLLENVSGLELTGTGDWEYTICGTKEKEFNSKYVVNFSRDVPQNTVVTIMLTDLTTGDTKYFHTRIAVPTMNFDNPVSEDTLGILHYYSVELPITLSSDENWCSSCGGSIPGWVTFTIEITNGQQYGNLYNKTTGERASSFTNIIANQNWSCGNSITDYDFIADGVQPDSLIPAVVKVRCTASDGEIGVWERNIYVSYNDVEPVEEGIIISFSKDHLAPGDTTEIILQRQNTDGSVADFTEWDSFEIGIIEGCGGGKIMAGDSLDSYFSEAYQPIYFVADSTITDTSITVGIRAGLIEGIIGASRMQNNNRQQEEKSVFKRNKKPVNKTNTQNLPQNNPAASCFGGAIEKNISGNGSLVVESTDKEILLGETKYFAVKKKTETGELKIEEIKTDYGDEPKFPADADGWVWQKTDVWGDNPVSVVKCDGCGKKMGVYWEKKYPKWRNHIYNKGEYLGRYFNSMANLSNGLIRIIGRYWHNDSTYIVNLRAKTNSQDSTHIKIKVIKPTELVSEREAATIYGSYSKTKDVFNRIINIDSVCNYYGGILGVSPHMLKGQMHKECDKTNFGGEVKWGFAPSYRYEPYTTQNSEQVLKTLVSNPFFIKPTTMVNPPIHQNLKPMSYYSGDTITVWQIIDEYSQLVDKNHSDLYGKRKSNNTMDFDVAGYEITDLQEKYNSYLAETENATKFDLVLNRYRKLTFTERADSANKRMIVYLRDEFVFKDANKTKGMKNMIAQTRIASSYGLFQVMYTTAIGDKWKYPQNQNNPPELLNEIETNLQYAINIMAKYISSYNNTNNWKDGYEETIKRVIFKGWNGKKYSQLVMNRSQLFIPKR